MANDKYQDYLKTIHWYQLKQRALVRSSYKCEKCQSNIKLQVHHKFYRPDLLDTLIEDLMVLCCVCHKKEHGLRIYQSDHLDYKKFTPNKKYRKQQARKRANTREKSRRQGWSF